jgi:hypothetical protein
MMSTIRNYKCSPYFAHHYGQSQPSTVSTYPAVGGIPSGSYSSATSPTLVSTTNYSLTVLREIAIALIKKLQQESAARTMQGIQGHLHEVLDDTMH